MGHHLKIEEIISLAKKIPKNEILVQTLQSHPYIEFEVVEMYGEDVDFKVSRPTAVRDKRTSAERMQAYRKCCK